MKQTKTEKQLIEERKQKLKLLKESGINPYPDKAKRTNQNSEITNSYEKFNGKKVSIVGRVRSLRQHGRISFVTISDESGEIQLAFKEDVLGKNDYRLLRRFDIGDFMGATGEVFKTNAGEISVNVKNFNILSKSLRPLPEKYHGLKDEELKLRKRYLDIIFSEETRQMVYKRSKFWQTIRNFMINEGFLEVETPAIETTTGGADARPFTAHHHALNMEVFFRISCGELWQKRLMVAGFEKTFEIGRIFRNEGMSFEHLQDYTQIEFYWAYTDYIEGMKFVEKLYKKIASEVFGTYKFKINGHSVDFSKKWQVYKYGEIIKKETKIDIFNTNLKEVTDRLKDLGIKYEKDGFNLDRGIDNLWKYCRAKLSGPGFLIDVPVEMEPLAKRKEDDPRLVQRFQVIIAGSEVGKGFSELNDPIDQAERFKRQQAMRDSGDEEAQMYDHDFVEALEYGMPPTFGFGVSERLFAFLSGKPVRETQIFPLMKPKDE
jgi:lysyl-tRNA synthetase, class II